MSFHRELRALRYIQKGDVLRLKSYIRRHRRHLQLDQLLPGGQSLLHAACLTRDNACALLLLRKGADPMQCDAAGNNALHVAAREMEKGEWRVYTDLCVPILKRCPQTMDVPNKQGTTAREILRRAEDLMRHSREQQTSPFTDPSSKETSEWREKLFAEGMDEYQEIFGQYDDDDYSDSVPDMESFESWADRIYTEYHARNCRSNNMSLKTKVVTSQDTSRLVEERRYLDRKDQMEGELRQAQSERYHKRCQEVFGGAGASSEDGSKHSSSKATLSHDTTDNDNANNTNTRMGTSMLSYKDIPWPLPGGTAEQMARFIAAGADSSDVTTYKRYLRAQRVTWHPDRFMQRCGARLLAKDRVRVLETVTALSQELNRLAELAK
ncbi:PREDICTED: NF-kappa-B inhibitor-like protein 1 [Nanorana parkeri]|uniref:NF-kappa-B inhibitor-like protein 1 n=1 Tax=Nanorana parkeri TaxID=125878 RepID=UPI0008544A13|nr:PREDICTED: NF-kappa-B inhibitor-like protein 1 [Nanorana parkeri]